MKIVALPVFTVLEITFLLSRSIIVIIIIIINTLFEIGKIYIALQKIYSLIYTN